MLDERQRTRGYAFQTIFIGAGAVLASTAPWFLTRVVGLSNVAAPGEIPITVRYAFYLGAAILLFTVLWRSDARRVGTDCVSTFRFRCSPFLFIITFFFFSFFLFLFFFL